MKAAFSQEGGGKSDLVTRLLFRRVWTAVSYLRIGRG